MNRVSTILSPFRLMPLGIAVLFFVFAPAWAQAQTPPESPTNLQAQINGGVVSLSWDAPVDFDEGVYRIYRSSQDFADSSAAVLIAEINDDNLTYFDTALPGSFDEIFYAISAVETDETTTELESDLSARASVQTFRITSFQINNGNGERSDFIDENTRVVLEFNQPIDFGVNFLNLIAIDAELSGSLSFDLFDFAPNEGRVEILISGAGNLLAGEQVYLIVDNTVNTQANQSLSFRYGFDLVSRSVAGTGLLREPAFSVDIGEDVQDVITYSPGRGEQAELLVTRRNASGILRFRPDSETPVGEISTNFPIVSLQSGFYTPGNEQRPGVIALDNTGIFTFYQNLGGGNLQQQGTFNPQRNLHAYDAIDINRDRRTDILAVAESLERIYLYVQTEAGGFVLQDSISTPNTIELIRTGDVNRDGYTDFVVLFDTGELQLFTNSGSNQFVASTIAAAGAYDIQDLQLVDLNGNGIREIVALTQTGYFIYNPQTSTINNVTTGTNYTRFSLADMNANGRPDLIMATDEAIEVRLQNATGQTFTLERSYSLPVSMAGISVAEFSQSGAADLFITPDDSTSFFYYTSRISEPEVRIITDSLDFGQNDLTLQVTQNAVVENYSGSELLQVTGASMANGEYFTVTFTSASLQVDQQVQIPVRFEPDNNILYRDTLIVQTNDPLRPEVRIPVQGEGIRVLNQQITGEFTLEQNAGPYYLLADFNPLLTSTGTMRIERGTVILMEDGRKLIIDGNLEFFGGTSASSVLFTGRTDTTVHNGLLLRGSGRNHVLDGFKIEDASDVALEITQASRAQLSNFIIEGAEEGILFSSQSPSSLWIQNGTLQNQLNNAVRIAADTLTIRDSEITTVLNGIEIQRLNRLLLDETTLHGTGLGQNGSAVAGLRTSGGVTPQNVDFSMSFTDTEIRDFDYGINEQSDTDRAGDLLVNGNTLFDDIHDTAIRTIGNQNWNVRVQNARITNSNNGLFFGHSGEGDVLVLSNTLSGFTGTAVNYGISPIIEGEDTYRVDFNLIENADIAVQSENELLANSNTIRNNRLGFVLDNVATISENNFVGNTTNIEVVLEDPDLTIAAAGNFWGTDDLDIIRASIVDNNTNPALAVVEITDIGDEEVVLTSVPAFTAESQPGGFAQLNWQTLPRATAYQLFVVEGDTSTVIDTETDFYARLSPVSTALRLNDSAFSTLSDGFYQVGIRGIIESGGEVAVAGPLQVRHIEIDRIAPNILQAEAYTSSRLLTVQFSEVIDTTDITDLSRWQHSDGISILEVLDNAIAEDILFVGNASTEMFTYINSGEGRFLLNNNRYHAISDFFDANGDTHLHPAFADFTGNGLTDLLIGTSEGLYFFRNVGESDEFPVWEEDSDNSLIADLRAFIATNNLTFLSPTVGDITRNGRMDLALGNNSNTVYLFENTGSTAQTQQFSTSNSFSVVTAATSRGIPTLADGNGNGFLDLYIGGNNGILYYRPSQGLDSPTLENAFVLFSSNIYNSGAEQQLAPALFDLDGDDRLEILLGRTDGTIEVRGNNTGSGVGSSFPQALGTLQASSNTSTFSNINVGAQARPVFAPVERIVVPEGERRERFKLYTSQVYGLGNYDVSITDLKDNVGNLTTLSSATFTATETGFEFPDLTVSLITDQTADINLSGDIQLTYNLTLTSGAEVALIPQYSVDQGISWANLTAVESYPSYNGPLSETATDTITWTSTADITNATENDVQLRIIARVLDGGNSIDVIGTPVIRQIRVDNFHEHRVADLQLLTVEPLMADTLSFSFELEDPTDDILRLAVTYRIGDDGEERSIPTVQTFENLDAENYSGVVEVLTLPELQGVVGDVRFIFTPFDPHQPGIADSVTVNLDFNEAPEVSIFALADTISGTALFSFDISDTENDTILLTPEYSLDTIDWQPATTLETNLRFGLEQYSDTLRWNTTADLPGYTGPAWFRVTPSDTKAGVPDSANVQLRNNQAPVVIIDQDNALSGFEITPGVYAGAVRILYQATDVENDTVQVVFEYQLPGAADWSIATVEGVNTLTETTINTNRTVTWLSATDLPEQNGAVLFRVTPFDAFNTGVPDTISITLSNDQVPTISLQALTADNNRLVFADSVVFQFGLENNTAQSISLRGEYSTDNGNTWIEFAAPNQFPEISGDTLIAASELIWNNASIFSGLQEGIQTRIVGTSGPLVFQSNVVDSITVDNRSDFNITRISPINPGEVVRDSIITLSYDLSNSDESPLTVRGFYLITGTEDRVLVSSTTDQEDILTEDFIDRDFAFAAIPELRSLRDTLEIWLEVTNENGLKFNRSASVFVEVDYNTLPEVAITNSLPLVARDTVAIQYQITDPDNNDVELRLFYSSDGITYQPATVISDTTFFSVGPDAYSGSILWASHTDLPGIHEEIYSLRLVPFDPDEGQEAIVQIQVLNNLEPTIVLQADSISSAILVGEAFSGQVTIPFALNDREQDSVTVSYAWRGNDASATWQPATVNGPSFFTSADSVFSEAIWNSSLDAGNVQGDFWFRTTVADTLNAAVSDSTLIALNNETLVSVALELPAASADSTARNILADDIELWVSVNNPTSLELDYITEYSLDKGDSWIVSNRITGAGTVAAFAGAVTDTVFWSTFDKFDVRQDSVLLRVRIDASGIDVVSNVSPYFTIDNTSDFSITLLELESPQPVFTDTLIRFRYSLDDPNQANLQIRGFWGLTGAHIDSPAVLVGDTLDINPENYENNTIDFQALPDLQAVKDSVYFVLEVSNENGALFNRSEPVSFFVNYNTPPTIEYLAASDTLVVRDTTAIPYRVSDPDGNAVTVFLEYELAEEWFMATLVPGTNITPVDSTEFEGELLWASYEDLRGLQDSLITIRLTPVDADTGASVTGVVLIDNNNPPDIRLLADQVTGIEVAPDTLTGNINIPFQVFDPDGDSVRVAFSFRPDSSDVWMPATLAQELDAVSGVDSLMSFSAIWSSFDDTDTTAGDYWIRAIVSDAFLTGGQDSLLLRIDNSRGPELLRFDAISKAGGEIRLEWEVTQPPLNFEFFLFSEQDTVRSLETPQFTIPASDTTFVVSDVEEGIYEAVFRARYSPTLVTDTLSRRAVVDRTVPEIAQATVPTSFRMLTLDFSEPVDTSGLRDLGRYTLEGASGLNRVFRSEAPRKSLMIGRVNFSGLYHYYIDADGEIVRNTTSYGRFTNSTNMIPTFGDLTGNGVYDAIVGMNTDIRVYLNEGTNENPIWIQNAEIRGEIRNLLPNQFTGIAPVLYPAISDSSIYDLYVVYQGSSLVRLRNTGTSTQSAFTEVTTIQPSITYSFPHITSADLNGNGINDIVVGDGSGAIRLYRNTNSYDSPVFATATVFANIGANQIASPAFMDITGNGITEMLVGNVNGNIQIFTRGSETSLSFNDSGQLLQEFVGASESPITIALGSSVRPVVVPVEYAGISEDLLQERVRLMSNTTLSNNILYTIAASNLADTLGNVNNRASVVFSASTPGTERPELSIRGPQVPTGTILSGDIPFVYNIFNRTSQTVNLDGEYSLDGGITWETATLSGPQFGISPEMPSSDTLFWNTRSDINTLENNVRLRLLGTSSAGPFQSNTLQNIRIDNRDRFQVESFDIVGTDSLNFDEIITFEFTLSDPDSSALGVRGLYKIGDEGEFRSMTLLGDTVGIGPEDYANRVVQLEALPLLASVLDDVTFKLQVTNVNGLIFNDGPEVTVPADYNTPPVVELIVETDTLQIRDLTPIAYRITDPDNDQVRMTVEYSDDEATWIPATLSGGTNILDIDPENYDSVFVWDSYADLPAVNNETYFLKVEVSDIKFGNTVVIPVNVLNNLPPTVTILPDEVTADTLITGLFTGEITIPSIVDDRELDPVTLTFSYRNVDSLRWVPATVAAPETIRDPDSLRITSVWDSEEDIPGEFGDFWLKIRPADRLSDGVADSVRITVDNYGVPGLREFPEYAAISDTIGGIIPIPFQILDTRGEDFSVALAYRDTTTADDWADASIFQERFYSPSAGTDTLFWDSALDFPGQDVSGIAFRVTPVSGIYAGPGFINTIPLIKNNQLPVVAFGTLDELPRGDITIPFVVTDAEQDSVRLQFAYSVDEGENWLEPTLVDTLDALLSAEAYADTLTIVWQSEIDLPDERTQVRFRIIAADAFAGEPAFAAFLLNNQVGPQITSFTPSADELGTSYTTISLNFNRAMDTSVNEEAVVICNADDQCYEYDANWLNGNQRFEIPLHLDTDNLITVRVSGDFDTGLRDVEGRTLDGNNDGISGGNFMFTFNTTIPGDFNGDGTVDILDLNAFTDAWRTSRGDSRYQPVFDLHPFVGQLPGILPTPNGEIDLDDLIVFARMWQESRARETIDWLAQTGQVDDAVLSIEPITAEASDLGSAGLSKTTREVMQTVNGSLFTYEGGSRALVGELQQDMLLYPPTLEELFVSLKGLAQFEKQSDNGAHPVRLVAERTGVQYEDARGESGSQQFATYHLTVHSADTLRAYELFLRYEEAVLELVDIQPHAVFDSFGGSTFSLTHADSAGSYLLVNAANFGDAGVLATGDTLATVRFRVLDERRSRLDLGYYLLTKEADRYARALYPVEVSTEPELPEVFELLQNYPNPFNASTNIRYHLPMDAGVTITIYDVTGRRVTHLLDGRQSAGYYSLRYDARFLATGVYFYVIDVRADDGTRFRDMRKMLLLK